MSPRRLAIAAVLTIAVIALAGWQVRRERLVKACLDSGGSWHGSLSACRQPVRPILQRDLQRS